MDTISGCPGRTPSARRDARRAVLAAPLLLGLALALAACGGGSATPSPAAATPSSGPAAPQGTTGTIAAVAAADIQVQNQRTGQVTVNFTDSTTISKTVPATAADVTVGSCVAVTATPPADGSTATPAPTDPVAATSVTISQPTAQGCRAGGGFGGGPRTGTPGAPPAGASRTPNPSRTPGAGPGGGRGRGAFGKVSAVSPTGFTVEAADASNPATTVTTGAATTYTKSQPADKTALIVGQCATAVGPSDETGAVTASAISVRPPGANGCTFGFPAGRGPGGQGQGGQGGSGGSPGTATQNG